MASKHLNTKNLMTAFAVSHMTIHHWRKGSESKTPLPTIAVKDQPKAVAFSPSQVKAWAKKHKIDLVVADLDSLIGAEADTKPGPKAKAPVKATKAAPVAKKAAKKASPLKGTKVSARPILKDDGVKVTAKPLSTAKPTEAKQARLRVVPVEVQQAA